MGNGLNNVLKFIERYDKFIVTTHESPDPDGIGACLAFAELLRHIGKTATIVSGDPIPTKITFMDPDHDINYAPDFAVPSDISDYAVVVLDTNSFLNTGNTYRVLSEHITDVFIVDHHEGGEDYFDSHFVMVEASSASEIVYWIYNHLKMKLSYKAAVALYAGIIFDTGAFKYKKTSANTMLAASAMIESGVRPFDIYERLFENNDLPSFLLKCRMMATVEAHFNGKLVLMHLTQEMLRETGAEFAQGEGNINLPLSVSEVMASVLLKQDISGPLKVSMRTKGELDVSEIAIRKMGGGHRNAAGFKSDMDRAETERMILLEMGKLFKSNGLA